MLTTTNGLYDLVLHTDNYQNVYHFDGKRYRCDRREPCVVREQSYPGFHFYYQDGYLCRDISFHEDWMAGQIPSGMIYYLVGRVHSGGSWLDSLEDGLFWADEEDGSLYRLKIATSSATLRAKVKDGVDSPALADQVNSAGVEYMVEIVYIKRSA